MTPHIKKDKNIRIRKFTKKQWILLGIILVFGMTLRVINAYFAKMTPFENQLLHTHFPKVQFSPLFRIPSIIFSLILGFIIIVVSSRHNKKYPLFPFIFLFLFSISPIQIIIGSTINPFIFILAVISFIIMIRNRFTIRQLGIIAALIVVVYISTGYIFLRGSGNPSVDGVKIHLLIDYKKNKIALYNGSFQLLQTKNLPDVFLHKKQISIGPDMSPLSLLIVHNFSHCNFDSKSDKLKIKEIYEGCQNGQYRNRQLNVDYEIHDKQLLSPVLFSKSVFINKNPTNWIVPVKSDGINIDKRYDLFTIQASSLYLFSSPGFDIWGKTQEKVNPDWWTGVERITFSIENEYKITYINESRPYIHTVYSFINEGLSWKTIHSTINLVSNTSYNTYDFPYLVTTLLMIMYSIGLTFIKKGVKKLPKILIVASLINLLIFSFFWSSTMLLLPLSIVFLYTNSVLLTNLLKDSDLGYFELGIIVLIILTSSLVALPYNFP